MNEHLNPMNKPLLTVAMKRHVSLRDLRLVTLMVVTALMTPFSCFAADSNAQNKAKATNAGVCTKVANTLQRISKMHSHSYENPLHVDSIETGGRTYAYQNIDLDRDGKPDEVEQSCGSPSDGTCTLYVKLSSGAKYEVEDEIFHVMRFESKYYVLVGHPLYMKNHRRRLFVLSANGAELVCKSF
jgi:hypothetical protein